MAGHLSSASDLTLILGMSQAPFLSGVVLIAIVRLSTKLLAIAYMCDPFFLLVLILGLERVRYLSDLIRAPPVRRQFMHPLHRLLVDKDKVSFPRRVCCYLSSIFVKRADFFPNPPEFFTHVLNKLVSILLSYTSCSVQQVGG